MEETMTDELARIEHELDLRLRRKRKRMLLLPFLMNFILASVWSLCHQTILGLVLFLPACSWLYVLPWLIISRESALILGETFGIGLYAALYIVGANAETHRRYIGILRALFILVSLNILTIIVAFEVFDYGMRGIC